MKRTFKIQPPTMPNFLMYEAPIGKKQDGPNFEGNTFAIEEFTKDEAIEYGELWKQSFIKHWEDRKEPASQ